VYIWLRLCQILTYFNNFCSAETGKMYKTGHAFTYSLRGRRPAARASDLRVVRIGPVCCEPHHRRVEASSVGLWPRWRRAFWTLLMIATLKITISTWQHCKFDNWRWLFTSRRNARIASAVLAIAIPSVRPSVRHTPILCQNNGT